MTDVTITRDTLRQVCELLGLSADSTRWIRLESSGGMAEVMCTEGDGKHLHPHVPDQVCVYAVSIGVEEPSCD